MEQNMKCSYCNYSTRYISILLNHVRIAHENTPGFHIVCSIHGCLASYDKVESLRKHICRKHTFNRVAHQSLENEQSIGLAGSEH